MKKETLDAAVGMLSEELLEETNEVRKVKQKRRRIQNSGQRRSRAEWAVEAWTILVVLDQ